MRGQCRDVEILTWCCAGRCLIQLQWGPRILSKREKADPPAVLTLITADDEQPWRRDMAHVAPGMGPMGIQHIDADAVEAMVLLYTVTRWASEIVLVPDDSVTIG
jgi:hypothetical protein